MSVFDEEQPQSKSSAGKYVVVLALLIVAGVGIWYLTRGDSAPETTATAPAPAPAPPPRSTTDIPEFEPLSGSVAVTVNIEGASVYLDGEAVGPAPFRRDNVSMGRHVVRVEADGFQTFERNVNVSSGQEASLNIVLEPVPVALRVDSDVPGAQVFVDRRYIGATPLTVDDLGPGSYEVTISAEGYDMHAETVELDTEARDLYVRFKEVRLQESVAVVHKHGFGSCEGRLLANPDGIQYQTDHDDAFFAPFDALETFEIDYTDNNLNLKVHGGRNYNFEEKDGNAEALFVFHRNVQAARERLAED